MPAPLTLSPVIRTRCHRVRDPAKKVPHLGYAIDASDKSNYKDPLHQILPMESIQIDVRGFQSASISSPGPRMALPRRTSWTGGCPGPCWTQISVIWTLPLSFVEMLLVVQLMTVA